MLQEWPPSHLCSCLCACVFFALKSFFSTRRHPTHPSVRADYSSSKTETAPVSHQRDCRNCCSEVCHTLTELPGEEVDEISEGRRQERAGKRPSVAHRVRIGAARSAVCSGRPFVVLLRRGGRRKKYVFEKKRHRICEISADKLICFVYGGMW